jgi:PHP family Zn ribbon phosphoesterase
MPSSVLKGASTEITAIAIQSFSLSCSSGEYGNQTKYATTGNAVIGTDQSISKQSVAVEDDKSILSQLREQSLETIAVVIDSSIDTISTHISSVAPLLVAVAQKDSKVKLKLLALKILLSFVAGAPKFSIAIPYVRLYPVKKMIIKGLGVVIDDRRRIVRKLAAKVRNEWSVLEK